HGARALHQPAEHGPQPPRRLAEGPVGATRPAGLGPSLHRDHVLVGHPLRHQCVTTTTVAVTSALSVATGSRIFQPKLISWSKRRRGSIHRIPMKGTTKLKTFATTISSTAHPGNPPLPGHSRQPRNYAVATPELSKLF